MTLLTSILVGLIFGTGIYLLLSRELKGVAMGLFLLAHAANLTMLASSRSPVDRRPPVLGDSGALTGYEADPLPQALILTAIVIGFALQAFLLSLLVVTWRRSGSIDLAALADPADPAKGQPPAPPTAPPAPQAGAFSANGDGYPARDDPNTERSSPPVP